MLLRHRMTGVEMEVWRMSYNKIVFPQGKKERKKKAGGCLHVTRTHHGVTLIRSWADPEAT